MYICNIHHKILVQSGQEATCPDCSLPYEIRDGIWLLDRAQRWDRFEFDAQAQADAAPPDLAKAQRHLEAANIDVLRNAVLLDVACGLGDLTRGLAESPQTINCDIYAFDHSVESLRRAVAGLNHQDGNRVHFSAQDASKLFLPITSST